jgi:hypothetical protein
MPHLLWEHRLTRILESIDRSQEGKYAALILIKQAIICIMHLENRVGEKLITVLLSIGAAKHQRARSAASLEGYVDRIQRLVQSHILETRLRPKQ